MARARPRGRRRPGEAIGGLRQPSLGKWSGVLGAEFGGKAVIDDLWAYSSVCLASLGHHSSKGGQSG